MTLNEFPVPSAEKEKGSACLSPAPATVNIHVTNNLTHPPTHTHTHTYDGKGLLLLPVKVLSVRSRVTVICQSLWCVGAAHGQPDKLRYLSPLSVSCAPVAQRVQGRTWRRNSIFTVVHELFSVRGLRIAQGRRFPGTFFRTTMGGGVSVSRANADDDENVKLVQEAKRQLREINRERELDALAAKDKALLAMSKRALRREVISSRAQLQAEIDRLNAARRDKELLYFYNESALKDREREVRELRRLVNVLGDEKVALESAVAAAEVSKAAVAATATECQANLAKRDEIIAAQAVTPNPARALDDERFGAAAARDRAAEIQIREPGGYRTFYIGTGCRRKGPGDIAVCTK